MLAACDGGTATLTDAVETFEKSGYTVIAEGQPYCEMLGAVHGLVLRKGDDIVNLFEYENIKARQDCKKVYSANRDKYIEIAGEENILAPKYSNGLLTLDTEDQNAIIIFRNL